MLTFSPTMPFNNVDFPTFVCPTIATKPDRYTTSLFSSSLIMLKTYHNTPNRIKPLPSLFSPLPLNPACSNF